MAASYQNEINALQRQIEDKNNQIVQLNRTLELILNDQNRVQHDYDSHFRSYESYEKNKNSSMMSSYKRYLEEDNKKLSGLNAKSRSVLSDIKRRSDELKRLNDALASVIKRQHDSQESDRKNREKEEREQQEALRRQKEHDERERRQNDYLHEKEQDRLKKEVKKKEDELLEQKQAFNKQLRLEKERIKQNYRKDDSTTNSSSFNSDDERSNVLNEEETIPIDSSEIMTDESDSPKERKTNKWWVIVLILFCLIAVSSKTRKDNVSLSENDTNSISQNHYSEENESKLSQSENSNIQKAQDDSGKTQRVDEGFADQNSLNGDNKDNSGSKQTVEEKNNELSSDNLNSPSVILYCRALENINIRRNPDTKEEKIGKVLAGDIIKVVEGPVVSGGYDWYRINNSGWIANNGEWLMFCSEEQYNEGYFQLSEKSTSPWDPTVIKDAVKAFGMCSDQELRSRVVLSLYYEDLCYYFQGKRSVFSEAFNISYNEKLNAVSDWASYWEETVDDWDEFQLGNSSHYSDRWTMVEDVFYKAMTDSNTDPSLWQGLKSSYDNIGKTPF